MWIFAVESAPPRRRALFGSFTQMGSGLGAFMTSGAFSLLGLLGDEAVMAWAWRVPFLASAVLIVVGLLIRHQLPETEAFTEEVATFFSAYGADALQLSTTTIGNAGMGASVIAVVCTPIAVIVADRYGVRAVTLVGLVLHLVVAVPIFLLLSHGTALTLACSLGMFVSTIAYATIGTLVAGWYPAGVRQTGVSLTYQLTGVLGGLVPASAQSLSIASSNGWTLVLVLFVVMSAISLFAVAIRRTPSQLVTDPEGATA
ncbi:MFS transporter [Naumannella halotolerans]|uniref:MFS transporter n=1 Tax=Naumannella halotolerans TaxID=993414 RepID=UPI00370DA989